MFVRRLAVLIGVGVLASCGGASSGDDDDGENFRTTYGYFMTTGNTSVSSVIMSIMGDSDLALIQTQTGTNQNTNLGFIAGRVTDGAGAPLASVDVDATNDSGLPAGAIFYQSSTTFAYTSTLTATSTTGRFIVMNVQPGRVNIRCAAGADGNVIVQVIGGTTVFAQLAATATGTQPKWSGLTVNLISSGRSVPGPAEPGVNYQLLGLTSAPGPISNGTTGAFDLSTVYARNTYLVKCTKTGMVDTYTYVHAVNTDLTAGLGGGNIFITSPANRDNEINATGVVLTAGTGIITGRVLGSPGFVLQCRDLNDQDVGTIMYGDNADGGRPSPTLTGTDQDGIFYVYNVPPGQVFIRAVALGEAVSTYVDAVADSITLTLDLVPLAQAQQTITISGALASLQGYAVPNGAVTLQGLGIGDVTDQFGEYTITNVPTRHVFIVRTAR